MALNPPLRDWSGKSVWLVGASSGIGQACADQLHAQGATVYVSARKAELLQAWVAAHPGADAQGQPRAVALPLDVTDRTALQQASEAITARGPLDLVVYCAGYYLPVDARAYSLEEMLRHEQVNYVGALYLLEAVLPVLQAQAARVPWPCRWM